MASSRSPAERNRNLRTWEQMTPRMSCPYDSSQVKIMQVQPWTPIAFNRMVATAHALVREPSIYPSIHPSTWLPKSIHYIPPRCSAELRIIRPVTQMVISGDSSLSCYVIPAFHLACPRRRQQSRRTRAFRYGDLVACKPPKIHNCRRPKEIR